MVEGSAVLARLPRSRRLRRTARHVEILGIVALRKVAAEVAIAALPHLAAVDRMAVAAVVRRTVAAEPTTAATAVSSQ
jgi:hypothetical protein